MVSHCFISWSPNPSLWRWRSVFLRSPLDVHPSPTFTSSIVCFREDDDSPLSDNPFPADVGILVPRALSGLKYGPWAVGMVRSLGRPPLKPSTGGPGSGGADDGRGGGGGGGGDDEGDGCGDDDAGGEDAYLLPMLTVALASVHMGYCVGVWARDEALDVRFLRTGVGLFCLLLVSALRLKCKLQDSCSSINKEEITLSFTTSVDSHENYTPHGYKYFETFSRQRSQISAIRISCLLDNGDYFTHGTIYLGSPSASVLRLVHVPVSAFRQRFQTLCIQLLYSS